MSISRQDVEKVLLLARLELSGDEVAAMTDQLSQIVEYVEQLFEVDTEGVEPMAHAIELRNVFGEDVVDAGRTLLREEALANAPKHDDKGYRVPAVLGD